MTATFVAFLVAAACPAGAIGLGDLKKKAEKKLKGKIEKREDEAADAAADAAEGAAKHAGNGSKERSNERGGQSDPAPTGGAGPRTEPKLSGPVASVSAKFDFIPGDRTLAAEDFTALKPGALSGPWKPRRGSAVVEEMEGSRWLAPKTESVALRVPLAQPLPLKWTLELDYALTSLEGASFRLVAESAAAEPCWTLSWPQAGGGVNVEGAGVTASGVGSGPAAGSHRIALSANGAALRVYLDRERLLSVPAVLRDEPPKALVLTLQLPGNRPRIAAVRVAAGPASPKVRLLGGSLTTYGIRFEPASDEVRPESAPILREIASFLDAEPAAKLSIRAHADDIPEEKRRADRARRRAAAVRDVLVSQFGVASSRLVLGDGGGAGGAPDFRTR
ncbi:MAG TPA: OmpA family protein, partial [Candidatus Eisenbacteria bacterium]